MTCKARFGFSSKKFTNAFFGVIFFFAKQQRVATMTMMRVFLTAVAMLAFTTTANAQAGVKVTVRRYLLNFSEFLFPKMANDQMTLTTCFFFTQRESILEQNEKRKGQLNLMLFEAKGTLADHNAGRTLLEDEVSRK